MWMLLLVALGADLTDAERVALKKVRGDVDQAWVYRGSTESTPPHGKQYVGADVTLWRVQEALNLRAIEAYDPDSGVAAGNPQYACLGPSDMKVPCEGDVLRVRLVWSVPSTATGIELSVWGKKLGKASIASMGPTLPRQEVRDLVHDGPPGAP